MTRRSVLLCTEGTYPFVGGGVSTWCDVLCTRLEHVDFTIQAITGSPLVTVRYDLPPNVVALKTIPLWGTTEPAEHVRSEERFVDSYRRRRATSEDVVASAFVPLVRQFLAATRSETPDLDVAGTLVHAMWRWFREWDWLATWRSRAVWEACCDELTRAVREGDASPDERPTVWDLTTCFGWLRHFLTPLDADVPVTDIVHTTLAGFPGLTGVVAKLERGTPFIVTDHGVYIRERYIAVSSTDYTLFSKRFLLGLSQLVSRVVYHHADVVATVADFNKRWQVRNAARPHQLRTIHNGVDPRVFVPRPKPAGRSGQPTVVAVARVFPLKDIETMIRAADVTRRYVPDVRYIVYGAADVDQDYTDRCLALIDELGLGEAFQLAGFHPKPAEVYAEGDVTVLSSISEGFPYTVIESMACGRPVVATDVGGVREALEGCGVVVPPRDPVSLGVGVARLLLDDDLRSALGQRSREEVLRRFRIEHAVGAYDDLYEELGA